ncbi:MAG TPA: hypothetical protein VGM56_10070 [Byssovorax sp.]|jgi:hypothetical protein
MMRFSLASILACGLFSFGCSSADSPATTSDATTGTSDQPTSCQATFAGNYDEPAGDQGSCATLTAPSGSAGWTLELTVQATSGVATQATFDLGATPTVGQLGPGSVTSWTVVGVGPGTCAPSVTAGCQMLTCTFAAGAGAVPPGTFSLDLTAVDVTSATPAIHGLLEATQKVQPGIGIVCGTTDYEELAVTF